MPRIHIPTPLRQYAGGAKEVHVHAATAGEALAALTAAHPELRNHLYNEQGRLRSFINIYLNDDDIRYLDSEGSPVTDADEISIVPSIAGGC